MESYLKLHQKSKQELDKSKNLLKIEFHLIQDKDILISMIKQVSTAMNLLLESILEFERKKQVITAFPKFVPMMIEIYERNLGEKRDINPKFIALVKELYEIVRHINHSDRVFRQGDGYVFTCDEDNRFLNLVQIKKYYSQVDNYIYEVGEIIDSNG